MKTDPHEELAGTFADDAKVDEKVRQAVEDALERHRRRGDLVCVWRDGKPTWVNLGEAHP